MRAKSVSASQQLHAVSEDWPKASEAEQPKAERAVR